MEKKLTKEQRSYFNNRINLKTHRYWVAGLSLRTKKLIIQALELGLEVKVQNKTIAVNYTLKANDYENEMKLVKEIYG